MPANLQKKLLKIITFKKFVFLCVTCKIITLVKEDVMYAIRNVMYVTYRRKSVI